MPLSSSAIVGGRRNHNNNNTISNMGMEDHSGHSNTHNRNNKKRVRSWIIVERSPQSSRRSENSTPIESHRFGKSLPSFKVPVWIPKELATNDERKVYEKKRKIEKKGYRKRKKVKKDKNNNDDSDEDEMVVVFVGHFPGSINNSCRADNNGRDDSEIGKQVNDDKCEKSSTSSKDDNDLEKDLIMDSITIDDNDKGQVEKKMETKIIDNKESSDENERKKNNDSKMNDDNICKINNMELVSGNDTVIKYSSSTVDLKLLK